MIKLLSKANFNGEIHDIGAVVNLSPNIENRMIENGLATRDIEVVKKVENTTETVNETQSEEFTCPKCGKVCKNQLGFNKHIATCKGV
jgi:uncharacterized C2H2 Zn-finger protein